MSLTPEELSRYGRQMMLPGFGPQGQEKLRAAQVLIAGVGGLGSPLALYLAAAGVGRIVLADNDSVSLSNLNRQILHWEEDLDRPKVESAADKLGRLNSRIEIIPRRIDITPQTVDRLVEGCQVVLDGLDSFETRRLLNRACFKASVPFIYGGVHGLTGMTSTFIPGQTACLACLFPGSMPAEIFPVLGATPGLIACLQATEAVKLLTGLGQPLAGRLLIYNGQEMDFREVEINPNPDCPVCHGAATASAED
ncbi:MAG: HesA/MoeB/ThiF family protein [Deltaproteobacteria bacterium]|nr:HesA/MoeB/ThiF family protein [Deltaproteobacteria bacterium]